MTGYTGAPSTVATDEVRFWIQDTDTSDYEFTDAEITYLLVQFPTSPILAARYGCQILANKYANQPNESLGELSISNGTISATYAQRAKDLLDLYNLNLMGSSLLMPTINNIRDTILSNYPSKMKYTDIDSQLWGTDSE